MTISLHRKTQSTDLKQIIENRPTFTEGAIFIMNQRDVINSKKSF